MSKKFKDRDAGYQAFRILQIVFVAGPILVGLDKFFYILTNWSSHLSPLLLQLIGSHDRGFIMFIGILEIIAGLGTIFNPKLFSYLIALWLICVIINLLLVGNHLDLVVRDIGLCLAAYALGKLSYKYAKAF